MKNQSIPISELPLRPDGRVYHLALAPDEIARNIILVGDPGRVALIGHLLDRIDIQTQNREICSCTGEYRGKQVSILSTGMGTDNIDIVLNELDTLANIDLKTAQIKSEHTSLNLVRLGTSGSFQADYEVGEYCISDYAVGLDGLMNYYQTPPEFYEKEMLEAFLEHMKMPSEFPVPYIVKGCPELLSPMKSECRSGITVSAPGFYGPQGRSLRLSLHYPQQNDRLTSFSYRGHRISNMEMECSALFGLSKALGHRASTVCLLIANRVNKTFLNDYHASMEKLAGMVLDAIASEK